MLMFVVSEVDRGSLENLFMVYFICCVSYWVCVGRFEVGLGVCSFFLVFFCVL